MPLTITHQTVITYYRLMTFRPLYLTLHSSWTHWHAGYILCLVVNFFLSIVCNVCHWQNSSDPAALSHCSLQVTTTEGASIPAPTEPMAPPPPLPLSSLVFFYVSITSSAAVVVLGVALLAPCGHLSNQQPHSQVLNKIGEERLVSTVWHAQAVQLHSPYNTSICNLS